MLLPAETAKAWVEEVKEHSVVVQWLTVASYSRDLRFESLIRKFFFFPSVEKTVMWMVFKKRSTTKPQDDGSQEEVWWYHQQWWPLPDTCSKFSWAELYIQQFLNYCTQSDLSMGAFILESWTAKFSMKRRPILKKWLKIFKSLLSCSYHLSGLVQGVHREHPAGENGVSDQDPVQNRPVRSNLIMFHPSTNSCWGSVVAQR